MWPLILFLILFCGVGMNIGSKYFFLLFWFLPEFVNYSGSMSVFSSIVFCVVCISASVFIYSLFYMKTEKDLKYFYFTTFLFVTSMILLVSSKSYYFVFLGWDGLGITSFLLVGFYSSWKSTNSGVVTFMTNRLGDSVFLLFLCFVLFAHSLYIPVILLICISITKSAQIPFSSWLPAAMAAPTPISALVHSSTLVTGGIILLMKHFSGMMIEGGMLLMSLLGVATMLIASLSAVNESDFKKIVALSTLSQLGLIYLMMGGGVLWFSIFHLLMHAFFKSLLFMGVGVELHNNCSEQHSKMLSASSPQGVLIIQTTLCSLCGLFFMCGLFSKDCYLGSNFSGGVKSGLMWGVLFSVGLTFIYTYKMFYYITLKSSQEESLLSFSGGVGSILGLYLLSVSSGWWLFYNFISLPEMLVSGEKFLPIMFFALLGGYLLHSGGVFQSIGMLNYTTTAKTLYFSPQWKGAEEGVFSKVPLMFSGLFSKLWESVNLSPQNMIVSWGFVLSIYLLFLV